MPIAAAIPYVIAGASAAATVVSTVNTRNAANKAADTAQQASNSAAATTQATADYNARVDRADEAQVALDSSASIDAMRKNASVYLSRQRASYAGAGVMADSGSPLAVQVATAGKMALQEQQAQAGANAKMQRLETNAQAGIAEGQSQADAERIQGQAAADSYHSQASAAVLSGAAKLIGLAGGDYNAGLFTSAKNTKAGLDTYGGGSIPGPIQ